jgi:hypothetical protein
MKQIQIQPGHIARHTPQGAGSQGRGAVTFLIALLNRLNLRVAVFPD